MKFLLTCYAAIGHVNPILPISSALAARGHDVVFLTGKLYQKAVEATGATFVAFHHYVDFDVSPPPPSSEIRGLTDAVAHFTALLSDALVGQFRDLEAVLQWFKADVIVSDFGCNGARCCYEKGLVAAYATMGVTPYITFDHDDQLTAKFDDDPNGEVPPSFWFGSERFQERTLQLVNAERARLELEPLSDEITFAEMIRSSIMHLQGSTRVFEYEHHWEQPNAWLVGPLAYPVKSQSTRLIDENCDLFKYIEKVDAEGKLIIHVSQGTQDHTVMEHDSLVWTTIHLLGNDTSVVVIATGIGLDGVDDKDTIPPNVRVAGYIPHAALLPYVSIMITNAGFGGVVAALQRGIPLICAGWGEDKQDVGTLVERAGAGINLHTATPTQEQLAQALQLIRTEGTYRENAERVAQDFAQHNGPETSCDMLEELVNENATAL